MKISNKPTSLMLVGILFICIFLTPALAEPQLNGLEQFNKIKEHHLEEGTGLGKLKVGEDTILFPWSSREAQSVRPALSCSMSRSPKKEKIFMDSSNSTANVQDLSAINSQKQRDLLYKDSQSGDPNYQGLVNTQDISVSGKENDKSANDLHHVGNYLNIDVHDISVSAVNTMKGGSAVATSNIIIEPVQMIVCPPEVNAKLK